MQMMGMVALLMSSMIAAPVLAQAVVEQPIPDARALMKEVMEHQKKLEKVRENYTYTSLQTIQDVDGNGKVTKTETREGEDFFVNGHVIERTVKKNGQPLTGRDLEKESDRVTKLVEKAMKTPSDQSLDGRSVSVSRVLEIMDVHNPRREAYRGRPTIVFDFSGRKNAKTHGMVEDATKKLQGTIWIDEADRQVAHMEVVFTDNFRIAGGLLASVQKGSNFHFDQAPVSQGMWLPTGGEGTVQARVLMLKNMRQHVTERDYDYKIFNVDAQQQKDARVVQAK
jgi:hypothetical protein